MDSTYRTVDNARVLVVSLRNAFPDVARCCAFEFEDVIRSIEAADLAAPRVNPTDFSNPFVNRCVKALELRTPLIITRKEKPVPITLTRDYEVLFLMCQRPSDLRLLDALVGWRERCKKVVCWIEELWAGSLKWERVLEPIKNFDHAFIGCRGTVRPLQEATGVACTYGLPAVDVVRFTPFPHQPTRSIDCYSMGRRAPASHEALYRRAQESNFHYIYDTVPAQTKVYDVAQHRTLLASFIMRSRYFVANKAKLDMGEQTGGQEEVGLRFFEGIAGGAVLIGNEPNCETFDRHFNWPDSCIHVDWNSEAIVEVMDELDRDPERVANIQRRNAVESLRRHDFGYRWRNVLETLGLDPQPELAEREARLHAIAEAAEAAEATV